MTTYPQANTKTAWHQDDYPGATMDPNVGVIHTTEGTTRPTYSGGASAPNYTAVPDLKADRLNWFAHFPDEKSSRALQNDPGGVETNTLNALQVELVGTCAPSTRDAWAKAGRKFVFWPDPPLWALQDFAEFVAWCHTKHAIPVRGPKGGFIPYPGSYGDTAVRFTDLQWRNFTGWCGHQHVPENDHGDPGGFPWFQVERMVTDLLEPEEDGCPDPKNIKVSVVRDAFRDALMLPDNTPDDSPARIRRRHVVRVQHALQWRYPEAGVNATGRVDKVTLAAWTQHEALADGTGRPAVPDETSLKALVGSRYDVLP